MGSKTSKKKEDAYIDELADSIDQIDFVHKKKIEFNQLKSNPVTKKLNYTVKTVLDLALIAGILKYFDFDVEGPGSKFALVRNRYLIRSIFFCKSEKSNVFLYQDSVNLRAVDMSSLTIVSNEKNSFCDGILVFGDRVLLRNFKGGGELRLYKREGINNIYLKFKNFM